MLLLADLYTPGAGANDHAQLWLREPTTRLRRNTLMQLNPSCRPHMQVQFGDYTSDDDDTHALIALKRLATMVFLGAEDCLRRAFVTPQRKAELCMLTESCNLRVHPNNKTVKSICGQPSVLNLNAGTPGPNPTRKRTYKITMRDLGNIKFYHEHAAPFNGPAPTRSAIKKRMEARAEAEVALQAVDGGFSATEPRRASLADPVRIAEYARRGLDMDRVLADDIYLIWRCATPDALGRILSPHFLDDEHMGKDLRKHFKGVFDFTAFRADERRILNAKETHCPVPVRMHIFPPTLDADLLLAQTQIVCGLAHHAANDDLQAEQDGREAAASQVQPQPLPQPIPPLPQVAQAAPAPAPAQAPAQDAQLPDDGFIDPLLLAIDPALLVIDPAQIDPALIDLALIDPALIDPALMAGPSSSGPATGNASNEGENADDDDDDDDFMNSIISGDVSLNDGNANQLTDDELAEMLGEAIPPIPAAPAVPAAAAAPAAYDGWLTNEPATVYLRWLGLTDADITLLDAFTAGGMQNPADDVAADGVMRSYTR